MSYKEIIEENLNEKLKELNISLTNLKEELGRIVSMVPKIPDISAISESIDQAIPEPPPSVPEKVETVEEEKVSKELPLNNKLLYYLEKLEYCSNQAEVLKELLGSLKDYAERVFVCIIKENIAKVWNHFGCENLKIQSLTIDITKDSLLKSLFANRNRLLLDKSIPDFIPVKDEPERCLISPLILKGKVAAFIYADSGEFGMLDHYSIDILIKTASLVLDLLPLRPKRDPLPPTLEEVEIVRGKAEKIEQVESSSEELFVESDEYLESPLERTASSKPPELKKVEKIEESKPYEPVEAVEEEIPPKEIVTEVATPKVAVEEEEPIPPEEIKEHEGAKRFARLLVQEIALYHPDEVEIAKVQKNLLALLRDDIEKSREAYEQRFQKPSIKKRDYFNKALIQYLANGDPSILGK